jgi:hypothetical protein
VGLLFGTAVVWTGARSQAQADDVAAITLTPADASIVAGGSQTYEVRGSDADGNDLGPVNATVRYTFAPDNPGFGNESPPLGIAGPCASAGDTWTCGSFWNRGLATVTATHDGVTSETSLRVVAGPADHLRLAVQGSHTVVAGTTMPVAARVEDAYYNATGDGPVSLAITAQTEGGGASTSAVCNLSPMFCKATDDGRYDITAAWQGPTGRLSATEVVTIVAGPPATLWASATPARVQPAPFPNRFSTLTATVADAFGNRLPRVSVTWQQTQNSSGMLAFLSFGRLHTPPNVVFQPTNAAGVATWRYEAGNLPGTDAYIVRVAGVPTTPSVGITVALLP